MPNEEGAELYLSDLSERDKPWDARRARAEQVQALYSGTEYDRYSTRILECSRVLEFALAAQDDGEMRFRLMGARFCRVRHCPVCQWRRTLMWVARALQGMPKIQEDYPKARWVFLTLTVKNVPLLELRTTVKDMNKAFDRLSRRKEWKPVLGWARSLEVTRSRDGEAHPHFHVLMMVRPSYFTREYVKQKDWRELWKSCLRVDYLPVVNVKTVKPKANADGSESGITAAIRETFKYAVKPEDLTADQVWLIELTDQMQNARSVNIGGVLRKYWKAHEPEDLVNADEDGGGEVSEDDPRLWFGWREYVKRYAKVN
ncbi:MAG: protein rep [Synechococcales cyanobacterium RM1_1_8]|nr:protein rep [Synechococcales cyanobacterium RM1_1_8]